MTFDAWLRSWLRRHPLRMSRPTDDEQQRFTRDVMERVRAAARPAHVPAWRSWDWVAWPQVRLALSTAAAGLRECPRRDGLRHGDLCVG